MSVLALLFLSAACTGGGLAALRPLGLLSELDWPQRLTLGFALGFGLLGWALWFLGIAGGLTPPAISALAFAMLAAGIAAIRGVPAANRPGEALRENHDRWPLLALAAVAVVLGTLHILQAVPPPSDADTLGYHFTLPKEFLAAGRIEFVPRAWDGAVPLLIQLTYGAALALGGEHAMVGWTVLSGWAVGGLVFVFARRWLSPAWSAVVVLIYLSAPVTTYGLVSGQVEPRIALFVMLTAFALTRGAGRPDTRWAIVAGLGCGLYAGSKYFGLLFCTAGLIALWSSGGRLRQSVAFCAAAGLAGCQWYFWNWLNTGDPLFPALWLTLHLPDTKYWSEAFVNNFNATLKLTERPIPPSIYWYFLYPIIASLDGLPSFSSGHVGLGPFPLLILPMTIIGVLSAGIRTWRHPLFAASILLLGFYTIWFVAGGTLRVRHLAPLMPVLLVSMILAANRLSSARTAITLAVALTLAVQMGIAAVFSLNAINYVMRNETPQAYLSRLVVGYDPLVRRLFELLGPQDKVALVNRLILYYLDRPYFFAHPDDQAIVDVRESNVDWRRFYAQLKEAGITHVLAADSGGGLHGMSSTLARQGCVDVIETLSIPIIASRTLRTEEHAFNTMILYRVGSGPCPPS